LLTPIEESKLKKKKSADPVADGKTSRMQSVRNWFFGKKESSDTVAAKNPQ